MAGTPTPTYAFPIPAPADPADVPTDLGALATKVDTVLNGGAPWGVKFGTPNNGLTFGGDTNLYRASASVLKTDTALQVVGDLNAGFTGTQWSFTTNKANGDVGVWGSLRAVVGQANQITLGNDGRIYFGSANDTNLYRVAAKTLQTDSIFSVYTDDAAWSTGDTGFFVYIHNVGQKRVLVGAADSGGAGKRALYVAN